MVSKPRTRGVQIDKSRPTPYQLWAQAVREFPLGGEARRARRIELMKAHGYLVRTAPGQTSAGNHETQA